MNGRPTTNSPSRAMTTVAPAKSTARPAVDRATMVASRGGCPLGQSLAVAGDDKQGVVDADTEADHGHQVRAEGRHGHEVAERHEDPEAHPDSDQRR